MPAQVMKSIIAFYTKAKAHLQLSDFYDACAQVCHTVTKLKRECGMERRVSKLMARHTVHLVAIMIMWSRVFADVIFVVVVVVQPVDSNPSVPRFVAAPSTPPPR